MKKIIINLFSFLMFILSLILLFPKTNITGLSVFDNIYTSGNYLMGFVFLIGSILLFMQAQIFKYEKSRKKILVIDNEIDVINSIKLILSKNGYIVKAITNVSNIHESIVKEKFDLILLDIRMPTMTGPEIVKLIRAILKKSVKIAYISSKPKKDVNMEQVDAFIQKPFDIDVLLKEVKKILKD